MNIEVGKFYKGATGRKYMVLEIQDPNNISVACKSVNNSLPWLVTTVESTFLESEWIDKPMIDRKVLPAWHKWAAMDATLKWFSFIEKPKLVGGYWQDRLGNYLLIPPAYTPVWNGKPKDSLIELDNQTT